MLGKHIPWFTPPQVKSVMRGGIAMEITYKYIPSMGNVKVRGEQSQEPKRKGKGVLRARM